MSEPLARLDDLLAEARLKLSEIKLQAPPVSPSPQGDSGAAESPPAPPIPKTVDLGYNPVQAVPHDEVQLPSIDLPEPAPVPEAPAPIVFPKIEVQQVTQPLIDVPSFQMPVIDLSPAQPESKAPPPAAAEPEPTPPPKIVVRSPVKPLEPLQNSTSNSRMPYVALAFGALLLIATIAWFNFGRSIQQIYVPLTDIDAFTRTADDRLVLARNGRLELVESNAQTRPLDTGSRYTSIVWDNNALFAVDADRKAVLRWPELGGKPESFTLNYSPRAIFARGQDLWTLDSDGKVVRQYLLNRSILGTFLQQIDSRSLPAISASALFVSPAGKVLVLEENTGRLLLLSPKGSVLASEMQDASFVSDAATLRLGVSADMPWLARVEGVRTRFEPYRGSMLSHLK